VDYLESLESIVASKTALTPTSIIAACEAVHDTLSAVVSINDAVEGEDADDVLEALEVIWPQ
jgi:hypothetical protein